MDINKLKQGLVKWGASEEEANEFIKELEADKDQNGEETKVEPNGEPDDKGEKPDLKGVDKGDETIVEDQEKIVDENQADEKETIVEETGDGQSSQIPPVETTSNESFDILKSQMEELKKANDGLVARIDSLQEMLNKSGVINMTHEEKHTPIGVNEQGVPAKGAEQGDVMANILRVLNGKGR